MSGSSIVGRSRELRKEHTSEARKEARKDREALQKQKWLLEIEKRWGFEADQTWDDETLMVQLSWWEKIVNWKQEWTHGREALVKDMDEFLNKTCKVLFNELGMIDGSDLAYEFLTSFRVGDSSGRTQLFGYHVTELKNARDDGDEERLWECCISLFDLMIEKLGSGKKGLEMIIRKQEHLRNTFMDSAALATFFSSITATTLQFSYTSADTTRAWTIVNLCWFASLVLSIASATNSFLGAIVHQSPETLRLSQRPDHKVLRIWFKFIPSTFLTISGLLFLIGICGFTHSSTVQNRSQGKAVQTVTLFLTSGNVLAILIMSLLAFPKVFRIFQSSSSSLDSGGPHSGPSAGVFPSLGRNSSSSSDIGSSSTSIA